MGESTIAYHAQLNMPVDEELSDMFEECYSVDDEEEWSMASATEVEEATAYFEFLTLCFQNDEVIPMLTTEDATNLKTLEYCPGSLNILQELNVLMEIESNPPFYIYNCGEDNKTEVILDNVTNFESFTYNSCKPNISSTDNLNQVTKGMTTTLNCPITTCYNHNMESVEKLDKFQPQRETANTKEYKSLATLSVFGRSVYTSDCPQTTPTRSPVEISIPALPQYRHSYTKRKQNEELPPQPEITRNSSDTKMSQKIPNVNLTSSQPTKKEYKLQFNKCTLLYNPPKPVYADITKH